MASVFVGNIAWSISEQDLGDAFAKYAQVNSVKIITDRDTGRSKGYGFVELADPNSVQTIISNMDGSDLGGRQLRVNASNKR